MSDLELDNSRIERLIEKLAFAAEYEAAWRDAGIDESDVLDYWLGAVDVGLHRRVEQARDRSELINDLMVGLAVNGLVPGVSESTPPGNSEEGSLTGAIRDAERGDPEALARLWSRLKGPLQTLVAGRLKAGRAEADGIAREVWEQVGEALASGRLDRLQGRYDLWMLLMANVSRRDDFEGASLDDEGAERRFAFALIAEFSARLDASGRADSGSGPSLGRIAALRLAGYSPEQIAARPEIRADARSIERDLDLVTRAWSDPPA